MAEPKDTYATGCRGGAHFASRCPVEPKVTLAWLKAGYVLGNASAYRSAPRVKCPTCSAMIVPS